MNMGTPNYRSSGVPAIIKSKCRKLAILSEFIQTYTPEKKQTTLSQANYSCS